MTIKILEEILDHGKLLNIKSTEKSISIHLLPVKINSAKYLTLIKQSTPF
jgi:hypothetical protein